MKTTRNEPKFKKRRFVLALITFLLANISIVLFCICFLKFFDNQLRIDIIQETGSNMKYGLTSQMRANMEALNNNTIPLFKNLVSILPMCAISAFLMSLFNFRADYIYKSLFFKNL